MLASSVVTVAANAANIPSDTILQDIRGDLLLWETESNSLQIWSPITQSVRASLTLQAVPIHLAYSPSWDRVLVGYSEGRINQISLDQGAFEESLFAVTSLQTRRLVVAGNYLLVSSGETSPTALHSFNGGGSLLSSLTGNFELAAAVWYEPSGILYHVGEELHVTRMNTDGALVSYSSQGAYFSTSFNSHLSLNVNGDRLLRDDAGIFEVPDLSTQYVFDVVVANTSVWTEDYLFTGRQSGWESILSRSDANLYGFMNKVVAPGNSPRLFISTEGKVMLVTQLPGRTIFSTYTEDLELLSRVSHGGADLLDDSARLSNLSTRVNVESTLIVGFVIKGSEPMRLLLRAIGPHLAEHDITDHWVDPQFEVLDPQGNSFGGNDDWTENDTAEKLAAFSAVGAFPLNANSKDAAMIVTLPPGFYTAQITRSAPGGRNVLFEVYDYAEEGTQSELVNLSTRTDAGSGDDALVVGFVVAGNTPSGLLVRAIGPGMKVHNIPNVLENPMLTLRNSDDMVVGRNLDWNGDDVIRDAGNLVGAFLYPVAFSLTDAALLEEIKPGLYTATATGEETDDFGNTLVEIFKLQ